MKGKVGILEGEEGAIKGTVTEAEEKTKNIPTSRKHSKGINRGGNAHQTINFREGRTNQERPLPRRSS